LEERKKDMSVHWEPSSKKAKVYDYRNFQQWLESNRYRELRGKVSGNRFDDLCYDGNAQEMLKAGLKTRF